MSKVCVFDHPLIQHKLSILRDERTSVKEFRELISEIAMLMCFEATRDLPLEEIDVKTPVAVAKCRRIAGKKLAVVPILRAGLGMVDGMVSMMPNVKVGHVGLFRDPETLEPVKYYFKMPPDIQERDVIVVDPMLATGGSASAAISFLKETGVKHIKLMSIIGAPEGVAKMQEDHPDVDIFVAALDDHLNEHGYIVPQSRGLDHCHKTPGSETGCFRSGGFLCRPTILQEESLISFRGGFASGEAAAAGHNGDIWSRPPTMHGTNPAGKAQVFLLKNRISSPSSGG